MSALAACAGTSGMEAANADEASAQMAMATLQAPDGTARGTAQAIETDSGVKLTITGENLPAGSHGVHVHMTGVCTPPDFSSAGGHWNHMQKQHGKNNPPGMHMGDLHHLLIGTDEIGRASCRERVRQYVSISVVVGSLKPKLRKETNC